MTPQHIALVRASFVLVLPIADTAAALFYQRLFELDPTVRLLFPADLRDQGRKLIKMLQVAVHGLSRLDTLVPTLQELGRRHARYGVANEQYATVGAALLWMLEQGLGEQFTPAVEESWAAAYALLAETMMLAAAQAVYA